MSTLSNNITGKRLSKLLSTGQALFHTADLALLLDIANANTLRVTLHRLTQAEILHRIQRGLYSILPPEKMDPVLLGQSCLHQFTYLTTESVLRDEGYILQSLEALTFVSSVSRRFVILGHRIISRRLHARFLHHPLGIQKKNGIFRATPERAIADMLYFDPWYHFDREVEWGNIQALQKEIGYPLTPHRYADPRHA